MPKRTAMRALVKQGASPEKGEHLGKARYLCQKKDILTGDPPTTGEGFQKKGRKVTMSASGSSARIGSEGRGKERKNGGER